MTALARAARLLLRQGDSPYRLSLALFLRLLGVCALAAFLSLWAQIYGLAGEHGVLPVRELLDLYRQRLGASAGWRVPTLLWRWPGDGGLTFVCGLGSAASLALIVDLAPMLACGLIYVCYFSLVLVTPLFTGYQWDALLLEATVLGALVAPLRLRRAATLDAVAPLAVLLVQLLCFRLMFCAGFVKLHSGDETWRGLTALDYHFFTQPLPNPLAYYAQQLPAPLRRGMTALVLGIELCVPPLIFFGRRARRFAAAPLILLQVGIAATGNYGFFNLLSAALCVPLIDDVWLRRALPGWVLRRLPPAPEPAVVPPPGRAAAPRAAALLLCAAVVLYGSAEQLAGQLFGIGSRSVFRVLAAFKVVNQYGLFAVMTTERPELVIEGSDDGERWRPYEFRYKPTAVDRGLPLAGLHMPRLDWQLWFAALQRPEQNPWLVRLCLRLREGRPEVLRLLAHDPFAGRPPRFVRVTRHDYRFTAPQVRRTSGALWQRSELDLYVPALGD